MKNPGALPEPKDSGAVMLTDSCGIEELPLRKLAQSTTAKNNDRVPRCEKDVPSLLQSILMGLAFYSRLPAGGIVRTPPALSHMTPVLGLVSLIIGLLPVVVILLARLAGLPSLIAAILGVGTLAMITGAMAEDGLGDSFDGLWGGPDRNKRLEIMRDSRQGTYGVIAIWMLLTLRISALSSLVATSPLAMAAIWLAAQILSRQGAVWLLVALPAARADGAAHAAGPLSRSIFWQGMGIGSGLAVFMCFMFVPVWSLAVVALVGGLVAVVWTRTCRKRIGGYSGDLIGGLQGLIEAAVLSTFIPFM